MDASMSWAERKHGDPHSITFEARFGLCKHSILDVAITFARLLPQYRHNRF